VATKTPSRKGSQRSTTNSRRDAAASRPRLKPFTVDHFRKYAGLLVFDDGERREPEGWQLEIAEDIFKGYAEVWLVVPEGNGKSTFIAELALYGADYSPSPWIPVGAASAKQARIIHDQATGFVDRTPGMEDRFQCLNGIRLIRSLRNGGIGIEVFAADPKTGDGVIPYPYALLDELHRQDDLRLYSLWKGKRRKRGSQTLAISTAGEPNTPFENMRDEIRRRATHRTRNGSHLRAEGAGLVLHEWMVPSDELCGDMAAVKAANPLSAITEKTLREDFDSPTMDLAQWKQLKCNRPTRGIASAITDQEWDKAQSDLDEIPEGESIDVGLDVAWKWDTTAAVPLWKDGDMRLLGPAKILVPPRDGSTLHPDKIKEAFEDLVERYQVETVVMDTSSAEDIGLWLEDELDVTVIDVPQGNAHQVAWHNAFMDGLRNGTLQHTGDRDLRFHVLNAVARRLPGGDVRFDRPVKSRRSNHQQDRRVIDALIAAAMVVEQSTRSAAPTRSIYEDRGLVSA
jgi:phage terminase large subunit-like protein